ncbi:MAG: hypothetical protein KAU20_03340 [Nanoarchaeota archaeon]|nr:hypothetical protein [Nanoarchaeota archaeon]
MKQNYLKKTWDLLKESFKEMDIRKVIFIVLYDLLFFSIIFFSFFIFGRILKNKALQMQDLPLQKITMLPKEELESILGVMQHFLFALIAGLVIVLLIVFISMCLFKGLIWCSTLKKKFNIKFYLKFLVLNLLWFLIWLIPTILLAILMKRELIVFLIIVVIPFLMHFTNLLYISFIKNNRLNAIKDAFRTGSKKIHLFLVPYAIIIILFIVISQLYWIYKFLPSNVSGLITGLIILVFMAWSRVYLSLVVKGAEKNP